MGHWDETCFASNLPIRGEVVAIPVIELGASQSSRIDVSRYTPVGPPVRGMYDSYGGIELEDAERALLEPLRQEILKTLPDVDYRTKDGHRESLRGIGVEEANKELHLNEELPEEEKSSYSTIRTMVFCGDSSWLKIPLPTERGNFGPPTEWAYYPVYWACMREEVYDYLVAAPRDQYPRMSEAERLQWFYDLFDRAQRSVDHSPAALEAMSGDEFKESFRYLGRHPLRECFRNSSGGMHYDYCGLQHYINQELSREIQTRFFQMYKLFGSMHTHRIILHRSEGCQDGDFRVHRDFHQFCAGVMQADMDEYGYWEEE